MPTILSGGRPLRLLCARPLDTRSPTPAVLLLHGAGGNVAFWFNQIAPQFVALGLTVYGLHYFDRTGTTRAELATIRDGVHIPLWLEAIRDTLAYIAADPLVDSEHLGLMGISLGGFLALALATESLANAPAAIVEISAGLVPPWRNRASKDFPPTLILHGDRDAIVAVANAFALEALLAELEVLYEIRILAGETHWFTPGAQRQILTLAGSFLVERLQPVPAASK